MVQLRLFWDHPISAIVCEAHRENANAWQAPLWIYISFCCVEVSHGQFDECQSGVVSQDAR